MTRFYKKPDNLQFLLMPASGDRSFEVVSLAASTTPYESGTVLVKTETNGIYRSLTASDLEPTGEDENTVEPVLEIAILGNRTSFFEEDELTSDVVLAVVRDATIVGYELILPEDVEISDVEPFLTKQGLILR